MSGEASESLITDRMPYVHWLSARHDPGDEFYPLAHLVLSGGPDGVWAARFDLTPHMIYSDIQLYYAGGRAKITAEHLELARRAREEYYDSAPTVADAIHHRRAREDSPYDGSRTVSRAVTDPFTDEGLVIDTPTKAVPHVTDYTGRDIELSAKDLPALKVASRCTFVKDNGRRCTITTPPGEELCTRHGGRIYTDVELRNIHRITKEKLLGAGEQAVDNLIELLNSTNDMVRLKAAEAILDRTGFTPGVEVTLVNTADGQRSPADILAERLARLSEHQVEVVQEPMDDVEDAELVDDSDAEPGEQDEIPPEPAVSPNGSAKPRRRASKSAAAKPVRK